MNTLSCPIPANINPLAINGFMFSIEKIPEVSFFCQEVNLPDISLQSPEFSTPLSKVILPGETLEFGTLNIQFLVDEKMANYKSIHSWLIGLGYPEDHEQYKLLLSEDQRPRVGELSKNYSDATLSVLGSNNKPTQTITFFDVVPIQLDSMNFQSNVDDIQYIAGNATFRYTHYKFN